MVPHDYKVMFLVFYQSNSCSSTLSTSSYFTLPTAILFPDFCWSFVQWKYTHSNKTLLTQQIANDFTELRVFHSNQLYITVKPYGKVLLSLTWMNLFVNILFVLSLICSLVAPLKPELPVYHVFEKETCMYERQCELVFGICKYQGFFQNLQHVSLPFHH